MGSTIRTLVAWLRKRWHADLAFVDGHRHGEILARLERLEEAVQNSGAEHGEALAAAFAQIRSDASALAQELHALSLETRAAHEADQSAQQRASIANEANWRALADALTRSIDERFTQLTAQRPEPEEPACDPAELYELNRKGVFVVGCARSGTTVMADCVNLSPDALVLEEAFLFVDHVRDDFASMFNNRHAVYRNLRRKGTWIPPSIVPESGGLACLRRLGRQYRFVGEKIALGPPPHHRGDDWAEALIQFHAKYFYHSHYFLVARQPLEAVWSMHKMFPDRDIAVLIENWLRVLQLCLDIYLAFPECYFSMVEDLDERAVARMAEVLDVEIDVPKRMLGRNRQTTRSDRREPPPLIQQYAPLLEDCDRIYRHVTPRCSRIAIAFTGTFARGYAAKRCNSTDASASSDSSKTFATGLKLCSSA